MPVCQSGEVTPNLLQDFGYLIVLFDRFQNYFLSAMNRFQVDPVNQPVNALSPHRNFHHV